MLSTAAVDSLTDCVATSATLIAFLIASFTGVNIDGYAGIVVSLFMAWSGISILKGIFSNLIGKAPDKKMIDDIKERILSYQGVLSVHDLSVYSYGPNKFFASVHIEVSSKVDVLTSHELIDDIERDFIENTNIVLTGHLDPIEIDNPEVIELKEKVEKIIKDMCCDFSIHDFRMVKGERRTNVLFDVAIPYDATMEKEEIKSNLLSEIKKIDQSYQLIVTIEYSL